MRNSLKRKYRKYRKWRKKVIKEAKEFQPWDYMFNLQLFKVSLEQTRDYIRDKGLEVDEDRLQKVKKMDRVIYLLDAILEDEFVELAEKELNIKYDYNNLDSKKINDEEFEIIDRNENISKINVTILNKSHEIENNYYDEFFNIIKEDIRGWWD